MEGSPAEMLARSILINKHRKSSECCPVSLLNVRSQRYFLVRSFLASPDALEVRVVKNLSSEKKFSNDKKLSREKKLSSFRKSDLFSENLKCFRKSDFLVIQAIE